MIKFGDASSRDQEDDDDKIGNAGSASVHPRQDEIPAIKSNGSITHIFFDEERPLQIS